MDETEMISSDLDAMRHTSQVFIDATRVYQEQQVEIARLRAALVALVETEPWYITYGGGECCYCGPIFMDGLTMRHKPDCAWVKAKALLEG